MEGKKVKSIIVEFDDGTTFEAHNVDVNLDSVLKKSDNEESKPETPPNTFEAPTSDEPPDTPPPPPPIKTRSHNVGREEDGEKIVYTYEGEKTMKNGEVKKVLEKRTHWKYPSVNEPRHAHLVDWVMKADVELLRQPVLSIYRDYCTTCKEENVKPFCYNVFARIVKGI